MSKFSNVEILFIAVLGMIFMFYTQDEGFRLFSFIIVLFLLGVVISRERKKKLRKML